MFKLSAKNGKNVKSKDSTGCNSVRVCERKRERRIMKVRVFVWVSVFGKNVPVCVISAY